jgi:hypothetical protein
MSASRRLLLAALLAGSVSSPALAQQPDPAVPQPPAEEEPDPIDVPSEGAEPEDVIVVTGTRMRGQVIGDIPPEVQLDSADVQAYGAGSVAELLDAIAPLTQSARGRGQGRPVILINGRRISGFSEVRNLPPEAIERVDILPEEVALRYGYRADQRVVNLVLHSSFNALTSEIRGGFATAGGRSTYSGEANLLRIDESGRWNIDAEYRRQTPLFESERNILERDPAALDERPFRTLLAESDQYSLAGTFNRIILGDVSATVNARVEGNESRAFTGLPPSAEPPALTRRTDSLARHLGVALNGDISDYRWSFTGNYDRTDSETLIATGGLPDRAETTTQVVNGELVANGSLFDLPGGDVSATVRLGAEHQSLDGMTIRAGAEQQRALSRTRGNAQLSLDVPIASRRRGVLDSIGDFSVNFNAEIEQLSDFGTLRTLGAGLNWSPIEEVRLIASITDEDGAPSMQQLGDPTVAVPNVRVFDFLRGETVDVTRIEGGNPDLFADNRRVWKLGLTIRPIEDTDLTLRADYTNSTIRNPIASFPTATPEIESAFPGRFVRDSSGRLVSIDSRPVNFERSDRSELRWGLNFSERLGSARPRGGGVLARYGIRGGGGEGGERGGEGRGEGSDAPQGGGGGRGSGGAGGRGGGGRGGGDRLQLGLFHTWHFEDEILIRDGLPKLDLLGGSAVGSRGGQPRHEIEAQAGLFMDGFGARLSGQWQSGTTVRGGPDGQGGTTETLRFSDFATVNLRLFANLDQQEGLIRRLPWLENTRVTLSVDNLFGSRLRVRDSAGATPISYQPDYLDPLGRTVTIGIRKQF